MDPTNEPSWADLEPRIPPALRERARAIRPVRLARLLDVLDRRMESVVPVVEAVRRRHNMSAILRSADAFGLQWVHLVTGAFRPSMGAARGSERWMNLVLHDSTTACLSGLRADGFRIFVADLDERSLQPENVPVDAPVALVMGSELAGVSPEAREMADGVIALPMVGFVESLNVSVAAAIILRTVVMRRRALVGADISPLKREEVLAAWVEQETRYLDATRMRFRDEPPSDGE